jgi:pantoate--beta-alanine ligase
VKVVTSVGQLQAQSRAWKVAGESVALVPSMGALHVGHLSLVQMAQAHRPRARVIVSIFVNPLQFGPGEDFERYPRRLEEDLSTLRSAGVEAAFTPSVEEVYPPGFQTRVVTGSVGTMLEGEARPGHFDGVATVVARLLGASMADRAYFGRKDAQQLAVVRRMVADLAIPVEIVPVATVREVDGLAMSSRNRYLASADRRRATALVEALAEAQALHREAQSDLREVEGAMRRVLDRRGVVPEYARIVDPDTFGPPTPGRPPLAVVAARVGSTRLIDNAFLDAGDVLAYRRPVVRRRNRPLAV